MSDLETITHFISTPLSHQLSGERQLTAADRMLELFHRAAREVPAYKAFLEAQHVNPESVKTQGQFAHLPLMTKQNYIHAYPLPDRCNGGSLRGSEMIAMSSGSTGMPVSWPRSLRHELDIATRFEQAFAHSFKAQGHSTLVVICFALGSWVGGLYTYQCCRYLAQKGYPLTLVTPGNNPAEIFRAITDLATHFDQVVLAGYPPFIKDIVDRGVARGVPWPSYRVKLLLAGEVFSEEWRSLICERLGSKEPCLDIVSVYGTADAGVLGNETPLSINIRRFFAQNPDAARNLFGESRLPTLVQYDACSRYFETHENTLVVSGDNGVPLVRYHIADKGGLFGFDELLDKVRELGGDPLAGIDAQDVVPLPFVYLFGRADFTVSYFGANVFPENISVALEQESVRRWVSGKFVLQVLENTARDQELHITVELAPEAVPPESLVDAVRGAIHTQLLRLNSEFANYVPAEYQVPHVELRPAGDPEYFPIGVKHRYTRQSRGP